jgi:hypothetical protein
MNMYEKVIPKKIQTKETFQEHSKEPFKPTRESTYSQISKELHKRSMNENPLSGNVIWEKTFKNEKKEKEYHILLNSKSKKGLPIERSEDIKISPDRYYPEGFTVFGLFDSNSVEDVQIASEFLNKNGLPTEIIRSVEKIEKIEIEGKEITIEKLKKRLIQNFNQKNDEPLSKDQIRYLEEMDFVVLERDEPFGERIADVINLIREFNPSKIQDLKKLTKKIFSFINRRTDLINEHGNEYFQSIEQPSDTPKLNPENPEDFFFYFTEFLPRQAGQYLAKLHNLKLSHGFANFKNWTAIGTLCDLDSLKGEPLDQLKQTKSKKGNSIESITEKDIIDDLKKSYWTFDTKARFLSLKGFFNKFSNSFEIKSDSLIADSNIEEEFPFSMEEVKKLTPQQLTKIQENLEKASEIFLEEYFKYRDIYSQEEIDSLRRNLMQAISHL